MLTESTGGSLAATPVAISAASMPAISLSDAYQSLTCITDESAAPRAAVVIKPPLIAATARTPPSKKESFPARRGRLLPCLPIGAPLSEANMSKVRSHSGAAALAVGAARTERLALSSRTMAPMASSTPKAIASYTTRRSSASEVHGICGGSHGHDGTEGPPSAPGWRATALPPRTARDAPMPRRRRRTRSMREEGARKGRCLCSESRRLHMLEYHQYCR
mmetsp:Transcript_10442/g.24183  ORF Transcript_10442/g.24183 Transcript_10442/m.24183 type:complete len:220 (+) Transcript_10442:453-1112(+)